MRISRSRGGEAAWRGISQAGGQPSQVASWGSHSAGIMNPAAAGVREVDMFDFAIQVIGCGEHKGVGAIVQFAHEAHSETFA